MLELQHGGEVARLLASTEARWDTTGALPRLRPGWLRCGFCGGHTVTVRFWRFHRRPPGATWPYRCDVSVKCCTCAAVWPHGLAISGQAWQRRYRPAVSAWGRLRLLVGAPAVEPTIWKRDLPGREKGSEL